MEEGSSLAASARRMVVQRLEALQRAGVEQVHKVSAAAGSSAAAPNDAAVEVETARTAVMSVSAGSGDPRTTSAAPRTTRAEPRTSSDTHTSAKLRDPAATGSEQLLQQLNDEVRACTLCRELACSRKQTVFGVGNPQPRVVFFGEAP